ncbi:GNAT family N-acetyltransferase [Halomarina ordinaria]|uniref:GNAT family N-acetyltransferase n=1 Tax=Halomarina ordinaria TaxID=3033939 RepID=A0ABD5UAZ0_9EURY|nr:GNAT family N-acetyltransferase [Halomarina sp. PSRA2]
MDVEAARMEDVDRVADLWVALAAGQREYGSFLASDENRATVREAVARAVVTGGLLVAREDGSVVGFVMFGPSSGAYEQTVEKGVVENLYVDPDHRGAGIGTALLRAAEEALRADGADVVALDVMAGNEAAQRLYRELGYRPHRITMTKAGDSETDMVPNEYDSL